MHEHEGLFCKTVNPGKLDKFAGQEKKRYGPHLHLLGQQRGSCSPRHLGRLGGAAHVGAGAELGQAGEEKADRGGRRWAWRGQRLRRGAALASEEQKQQPQVQATDGGTWREGRAATRRRGLSAGRERRWGGGAPFPATAEGGGRRLLLPVQHKSEREM